MKTIYRKYIQLSKKNMRLSLIFPKVIAIKVHLISAVGSSQLGSVPFFSPCNFATRHLGMWLSFILEFAVRSFAVVHVCNCKVLSVHRSNCANHLCSCAGVQLNCILSVLLAARSSGVALRFFLQLCSSAAG